MRTGSSDRLMSDINVTPFVDVILVLLIIFMVTAPMMVQGVNVSLPAVTADPLPAKEERVIVTIDRQQRVYINDYPVAMDFLQEKLAKILSGRQDREVFLRADKEIPYGRVVRVMAAVKAAGASKMGMITEPFDLSEDEAASGKHIP